MQRVRQALTRVIEKWPDRTAVAEGGLRWTYAELSREIAICADRLKRAGACKGDRILLWLPNSAQYIASYLAVLEQEAVVVAAYWGASIPDVLSMISHAGASGIITTDAHWKKNRAALEPSRLGFAILPGATVQLDRSTKANRAPHDLAQILYTSGTTGKPKGVMLSHGNLIENTESILDGLRLGPEDSVVAVLPFVFAYGNSVFLTHLFAGGKIVIEENLLYPRCIVDSIAKEEATGFSGVASHYAYLLRDSNFQAKCLPSLRYFTSAGGPMPWEILENVRAAFPGVAFHLMYGQTEATARLAMLPPGDLEKKMGSAGCPIAGVKMKIINEQGEALGPYQTGEILVRGPNVMQGYWHAPRETESAIRDGWLRTGDIGYLDEGGYLFITGRKSEMIKSGAFRVHPEEVEAVLMAHGDVLEAGVVGVEDELLGKAIVAAVVLKPGSHTPDDQLLAHCARHLASYKRPKTIYPLAELPRSGNGKLSRQSLRERLQFDYERHTLRTTQSAQ